MQSFQIQKKVTVNVEHTILWTLQNIFFRKLLSIFISLIYNNNTKRFKKGIPANLDIFFHWTMQCVLILHIIAMAVHCFDHPHQFDHPRQYDHHHDHLENKRSLQLKVLEHHPVLSDAWTQVDHPHFLLVSKTPDHPSPRLLANYENSGLRVKRSIKQPR